MSNRVMKESGIEWIGEIPNHWDVRKLDSISKVITDFVASGSFSSLKENVEYKDEPDYAMLVRTIDLSNNFKNSNLYITKESYNFLSNSNLFGGELILSNIGSVGNVYYFEPKYERNSLGSNAIMVRTNYWNKFYYYWFLSSFGNQSLRNLSNSAVQMKFNKTQLRALKVPLPPLYEQQAIATYLDEKVSRLDQLIQDQQRVIEEWKAYKQSLVTETVTKGLNPEVELKDSGIEWMGEIPSHWEVKKVKNNFQLLTGSTPKSDELSNWGNDLIWVTPVDFKAKSLFSSTRKLSWKGYNSCGTTLVPKNSILITCRAPIGAVALAGTELCFNQGCKGLVAKDDDVLENYFYYYFVSNNQSLNLFGRGTTFLELSSTVLNNFPIPVPPLSEQQQITNYLDEKCSKIDQLIENKQKLIEELKSYKQSLIYECVTGKKEIV